MGCTTEPRRPARACSLRRSTQPGLSAYAGLGSTTPGSVAAAAVVWKEPGREDSSVWRTPDRHSAAAAGRKHMDPLRVTVVLVTVTAGRLGVGEPPGCRARGPRGSLSLKVGGREAPAGREQTAAAARAGRASDSDEPERGIHHNASQSKWRPPLPDSE